MPQFVCPTCGARLYSASQLTRCAWCGTQLTSDEKVDDPERGGDESGDDEAE